MASQENQANLLNSSQSKSNHSSSKSRKSKQKKEAQIKQNAGTQAKKENEAKINQEPLAPVEKEPISPSKVPEIPLKEPELPSKEPELPPKQPESPPKQAESPPKQPEMPAKQPELPAKQPNLPAKQPELPAKSESPLKIPKSEIKKEPGKQFKKEPDSQIKKEPEIQLKKEPETQIKKELDSQIKKEPMSEIKIESEIANKSLDKGYTNEDFDVDLSDLQIASNLLDKTFGLDDPDFDIPEDNNEACKSLMGLCSSSTENIKKSIYEILNSREQGEITEEDTTTVLQESLNQKMEDFKKVISGYESNSESTHAVEQTSSEATEVSSEEKEHSVDAQQVDSCNVESEKVIEEVAEKSPSPDMTVDLSSEEQSQNNSAAGPKIVKAVKGKSKSNNNSNEDTGSVAEKVDNTPVKTNAKSTKVIENKADVPVDSPASNLKPLSSILEARKSEREALRNSISPDDERFARKQRNVAAKKKGEKTYDQVLKSLGNGTAEEKLHLLCKKHVEVLDEFRLMEPRLKQLERQYVIQQRERESSQAELNRMILAKSRLEGLCREMQRQSRAVKEESLQRIKEEEEKRKEIANKFQATLNDISSLMQENSKKNIQLRDENAQLATKLKGLVDNYEIWEQNINKVVQQKELETQLAKAKHAKVNLLLKQETEKFLREKQSLLENLSELQKRCTVLTSNELQLRTELSDYTSKYEEFQSVLSNSSKVFSTFKNDMETTSKKIKKLEKETNVYKQKWESSNKALLDMISHKDKQDKDFSNAQQRILTLEKLCRALQAERNDLQNQINVYSSNSVPSTNTDVPPLATDAGVV